MESKFKLGVYFHPGKGFAILQDSTDEHFDWSVYKDKKKRHPYLRLDIPVHESGTGDYFLEKSLKDYEYVGEL